MATSYAYDAPYCAHEEVGVSPPSIYLVLDNTPQIQSKTVHPGTKNSRTAKSLEIDQEIVCIEGTMQVTF